MYFLARARAYKFATEESHSLRVVFAAARLAYIYILYIYARGAIMGMNFSQMFVCVYVFSSVYSISFCCIFRPRFQSSRKSPSNRCYRRGKRSSPFVIPKRSCERDGKRFGFNLHLSVLSESFAILYF